MKRLHSLTVNVLTLFPEILDTWCSYSILKRAREKGLFEPRLVNPREYTRDRHHTVDDKPYGGGAGMVLKIEPIARALAYLRRNGNIGKVYCLSPTGVRFNQDWAKQLARQRQFTLICGHYEGIDQRVVEHLCDGEISVGDYVLTGGEPAAAIIMDAVVRLLPGVLGDDCSAVMDSFMDGLLDYPHYTRPRRYRNWSVPTVLLSGDHAHVAGWRRDQQLTRTFEHRPDLITKRVLTAAEYKRWESWQQSSPMQKTKKSRRKNRHE